PAMFRGEPRGRRERTRSWEGNAGVHSPPDSEEETNLQGSMRQWDIYTHDPGYGAHPAVIVSHPQRAANKPLVEVLLCSSQRANRPPKMSEVLLDSADGLNWDTICNCDLIFSVNKADLRQLRGQVTLERRKQIIRTIILSHNWVCM